uniref:Uncharacterized protein n=1 Tax=Prolemur simus TaxID=1328070 RepID=A0A8C9DMY0_PROSS
MSLPSAGADSSLYPQILRVWLRPTVNTLRLCLGCAVTKASPSTERVWLGLYPGDGVKDLFDDYFVTCLLKQFMN